MPTKLVVIVSVVSSAAQQLPDIPPFIGVTIVSNIGTRLPAVQQAHVKAELPRVRFPLCYDTQVRVGVPRLLAVSLKSLLRAAVLCFTPVIRPLARRSS